MSETTGEQKPAQKKQMMLIVCFFLGTLGIHRMMMGYKNWWVRLLLSIFCITLVISYVMMWIDFFAIMSGKLKMADGRDLEK